MAVNRVAPVSRFAGSATGRVTQEVAEGMHGAIVKVVKNGEYG
jgi:hypothetical protein